MVNFPAIGKVYSPIHNDSFLINKKDSTNWGKEQYHNVQILLFNIEIN